MDEFSDPKPIATVEQFKAALLARGRIGIPAKHLAMLISHCRAPNHTISTVQLAKEVGYPGNKTVNLQYGTLAHNIAKELHHTPGPFSTGDPHWWRTLASGKDGIPKTSDRFYKWIMRPELVQAVQEVQKMFPRWKWLTHPRSKQHLDDHETQQLLKSASLLLKTPPVSVKISGGGFGSNPEQIRLVEQAACKAVKKHFEQLGYKVVSREKENLGYDFDVSRNGRMLHIEVKGVSSSLLKFPITENEVHCARSDSKFQLAIVTNATTPRRKMQIFTRKEFLKTFELTPIAYFAEAV